MHLATPRASLFLLCVDDYREFVRAWLDAPGPLREPVPTRFNDIPVVVERNGFRSYVIAAIEPPEIWIL